MGVWCVCGVSCPTGLFSGGFAPHLLSVYITLSAKWQINIRANDNLFRRIRNPMRKGRGGAIATLCTQSPFFDHIIAIRNQFENLAEWLPTIIPVETRNKNLFMTIPFGHI